MTAKQWSKRKTAAWLIGWLLVLIIGILLLDPYHAKAQPPVTTLFRVECAEQVDATLYRLHFGYWSTGVETFTTLSSLPTTAPETFTTAEGEYFEWTADIESGVIGHVIVFTGATTHELPLNAYAPACDVSDVQPTLTPDVEVSATLDSCPAWSYESATGNMICLYDLPKVGE